MMDWKDQIRSIRIQRNSQTIIEVLSSHLTQLSLHLKINKAHNDLKKNELNSNINRRLQSAITARRGLRRDVLTGLLAY